MTTSTTDRHADDRLTVELAYLRDELDVMCRFRREGPFSELEEARWAGLNKRELALIVEVRALQRPEPADFEGSAAR